MNEQTIEQTNKQTNSKTDNILLCTIFNKWSARNRVEEMKNTLRQYCNSVFFQSTTTNYCITYGTPTQQGMTGDARLLKKQQLPLMTIIITMTIITMTIITMTIQTMGFMEVHQGIQVRKSS